MKIGLLKEPGAENRVALLPEAVETLIKMNVEVGVEKGAGERAFAYDADYERVGARIAARDELLGEADLLLQIQAPDENDLNSLNEKQVWMSAFNPLWNTEVVRDLQQRKLTSFSLDMIPRISRAQAMDVLSSMATVSGYMAVLEAALRLPTFFPMFMTAAGTIRPANVLVLGAGVAGLQAIATARRLGAQVRAFDVRSEVKEQVMSLGARFVEVEGAREDKTAGGYAVEQTEEYKQRQQQEINRVASESQVVICTAQIPGRRAPLLLPKEAVEAMRPGSVIVDLAASTGGNCELTENNKVVKHGGVTIVGQSNYPSQKPIDASRMFGKNVLNFMKLLIDEQGALQLNFEDEIVKGTCITHQGELFNERVKAIFENL